MTPNPDTAPNATPASEPSSEPGTVEQAMFDKPNLQLSDPDPYAFANRIWRLTAVFTFLALLAAGPYLAGQFWYMARYNTVKAEHDASSEILKDLRARLQDFSQASRMVAKKVGPSVVNIYKPGINGETGQGSGVIMDTEGYILTNNHVVEKAAALIVQIEDGREFQASIVGYDHAMDLAVLKIEANNLIAAEWGDSESLELGDMVWALGSPFGLSRSVTFGIVSAKRRNSSSGVRTNSAYQEYLQTDVAVNRGNSGGPLVNLEGRVVGINTAILGPHYQGVSFAIPSQLARDIYDQLRDNVIIERGYLGVLPEMVTEKKRRQMGIPRGEGVLITEVVPNGPASQGGLQPNDVIMQWNDHQASDPVLLSRTIAGTPIGSTATVLVKRIERGEVVEKSLNVEVGVKPLADGANRGQ